MTPHPLEVQKPSRGARSAEVGTVNIEPLAGKNTESQGHLSDTASAPARGSFFVAAVIIATLTFLLGYEWFPWFDRHGWFLSRVRLTETA